MPSTVVAATDYNPDTQVLKVIYVSGSVYAYEKVPQEVYTEMRSAKSKGKFLNERIKPVYAFTKLND